MDVSPLLRTRNIPGGETAGVFVVDSVLVNSARIELVVSGSESTKTYRLRHQFMVNEGGLYLL